MPFVLPVRRAMMAVQTRRLAHSHEPFPRISLGLRGPGRPVDEPRQVCPRSPGHRMGHGEVVDRPELIGR